MTGNDRKWQSDIMAITPIEAVEVARQFGLTLPDARALSLLADTTAEARELARRFAPAPVKEMQARANDDLVPQGPRG